MSFVIEIVQRRDGAPVLVDQENLQLLARHVDGVRRLLARSKIEPSKLIIVIAHADTAVGRALIAAGLPIRPGRSSLCVPVGVDSAMMFAELLDLPEVKLLGEKHSATPVVIVGRSKVEVAFERFVVDRDRRRPSNRASRSVQPTATRRPEPDSHDPCQEIDDTLDADPAVV